MFKKLYKLGRVRLFSPAGILMVIALILLDEILRQEYFFQPSDIFVPRITHEKWVVALLMVGAFSQYRRVRASKRTRNEELPGKI